MTFGQLLLKYYHMPVGKIRSSLANGGPWAEKKTERHRSEMETTAGQLPPLPQFDDTAPVTLHLMTGRRFWYQTAFCLHSFAQVSQTNVHAEIYDDGSIDDSCSRDLLGLGPNIKIHYHKDLRAQVERLLPLSRFPVLRERWENYPNIRKLIDVHLDSHGWKLVIDSDLLFFRRPDFLLNWLGNPSRLLHAIDCEESYGYSRSLMEKLAGKAIPPLVNVGLCGLNSDNLDWAELEAWTAVLQSKEKTNYYLEQALVAMIAARTDCTAAPVNDYMALPSRSETINPTAVMHHYVATAKRWYYRYGWRHIVATHIT